MLMFKRNGSKRVVEKDDGTKFEKVAKEDRCFSPADDTTLSSSLFATFALFLRQLFPSPQLAAVDAYPACKRNPPAHSMLLVKPPTHSSLRNAQMNHWRSSTAANASLSSITNHPLTIVKVMLEVHVHVGAGKRVVQTLFTHLNGEASLLQNADLSKIVTFGASAHLDNDSFANFARRRVQEFVVSAQSVLPICTITSSFALPRQECCRCCLITLGGDEYMFEETLETLSQLNHPCSTLVGTGFDLIDLIITTNEAMQSGDPILVLDETYLVTRS